ncbi:hypothetical protein [Streptomyces sp. NPDC050287]|uniref:hypothetical protein n=1 Tax=Streptomyces sp. NPDC050287 TaxID=3365608 RepID=UPI0037B07772
MSDDPPEFAVLRAVATVNARSTAATTGLPERALSSATKGAVLSLTRATAAGLLPFGIRVDRFLPRHR